MSEHIIGFEHHDHDDCIAEGVDRADEVCRRAGARLTPVRKRVLEILLQRHTAMGAYDVLEILREEGFGSQPPVAYRALDFLVQHGLAHRIERLNAFVACSHIGSDHAPSFLICRVCDRVAEAPSPAQSNLKDVVKDTGFVVERAVVEAVGVCASCQTA